MRMIAVISAAAAFAIGGQATAAAPDLASSRDFARTCRSLERLAPNASPRQMQAHVICRDVRLVQHAISFAAGLAKSGALSYQDMAQPIREELAYVRKELESIRTVLQQIRIGRPADSLLISPATWEVDLNGNGKLETWERYFFAIPRQHALFAFRMPSDDVAYYQAEYRLDAQIKVDQSDLAWALSYHSFAEALAEILLAYKLEGEGSETDVVLDKADALPRAHALLLRGFQESERMQRSVLAERKDDSEWIANPRQRNTVFPIALTQADFDIWGQALRHIIPLVQGRTLLAPDARLTGLVAAVGQFCPEGQGLNFATLFHQPLARPLALLGQQQGPGRDQPPLAACETISADRPASGLVDFIGRYATRAAEDPASGMALLRRMLWVN